MPLGQQDVCLWSDLQSTLYAAFVQQCLVVVNVAQCGIASTGTPVWKKHDTLEKLHTASTLRTTAVQTFTKLCLLIDTSFLFKVLLREMESFNKDSPYVCAKGMEEDRHAIRTTRSRSASLNDDQREQPYL